MVPRVACLANSFAKSSRFPEDPGQGASAPPIGPWYIETDTRIANPGRRGRRLRRSSLLRMADRTRWQRRSRRRCPRLHREPLLLQTSPRRPRLRLVKPDVSCQSTSLSGSPFILADCDRLCVERKWPVSRQPSRTLRPSRRFGNLSWSLHKASFQLWTRWEPKTRRLSAGSSFIWNTESNGVSAQLL
jgi:hypothetical protein